ncbi:MAG: hypothetical protein O7E52_11425 [Candidatus Poribacteria bacterium]|nr:hypothetical protein [Candidatus Poribacteria bacterium]
MESPRKAVVYLDGDQPELRRAWDTFDDPVEAHPLSDEVWQYVGSERNDVLGWRHCWFPPFQRGVGSPSRSLGSILMEQGETTPSDSPSDRGRTFRHRHHPLSNGRQLRWVVASPGWLPSATRVDEQIPFLEKYDFIAIIELKDEVVRQRTEAMLAAHSRDYDYQISPPVGRGVKERYAFLHDAARVEVIEAGQIYDDPDDLFIREPYVATFRAGEFDFTVIAIHIIWGKTVRQRRAEISRLDDVYRAIQDADPTEPDILLIGDFNRNPEMTCLFNLPQKSHIKDTSLYDNIWIQTDSVTEYTGRIGIDRFDEIRFGNDDRAASLAVSDHRPVWAEFRVDYDDD